MSIPPSNYYRPLIAPQIIEEEKKDSHTPERPVEEYNCDHARFYLHKLSTQPNHDNLPSDQAIIKTLLESHAEEHIFSDELTMKIPMDAKSEVFFDAVKNQFKPLNTTTAQEAIDILLRKYKTAELQYGEETVNSSLVKFQLKLDTDALFVIEQYGQMFGYPTHYCYRIWNQNYFQLHLEECIPQEDTSLLLGRLGKNYRNPDECMKFAQRYWNLNRCYQGAQGRALLDKGNLFKDTLKYEIIYFIPKYKLTNDSHYKTESLESQFSFLQSGKNFLVGASIFKQIYLFNLESGEVTLGLERIKKIDLPKI